MNCPFQQKLYKKTCKETSLEIIYLIDEYGYNYKYGVFSVVSCNIIYRIKNEINTNIKLILYNYYNEQKIQYDPLGYDLIHEKYKNLLNPNDIQEIINITEKERKISLKFNELDDEYDYYKNIFLFYLNEKCQKKRDIFAYFELIRKIDNENLLISISDKIKIINYFSVFIVDNKKIPEFVHINNIDSTKYIQYKLAFKLQKDIIENLKESSLLFYAILQFNSYSLLKIDERTPIEAYSISMERLEKMKLHLNAFQNKFFFIIDDDNELSFYASFGKKTGITCINEYRLFKNLKNRNIYDKAFTTNLELTHECMGHAKEVLNNKKSPKIYFNKYFRKKTIQNEIEEGEGEPGRVIEGYICDNFTMAVVKKICIFGDLLNYKYFVDKDFNILNNLIEKKLCKEISFFKLKRMKHKILYYIKIILKYLKIPFIILFLILILLNLKDIKLIIIIILILNYFLSEPKNTKAYNKTNKNYLNDYLFNNVEKRLIYPDDFIYCDSDDDFQKEEIKENYKSQEGKEILKGLNFERYCY